MIENAFSHNLFKVPLFTSGAVFYLVRQILEDFLTNIIIPNDLDGS